MTKITANLQRSYQLDTNTFSRENRTVKLAISSTLPYGRYFGDEILSHDAEAIDISRLRGAPALWMHDLHDIRGILESFQIDTDGVLRGTVRFAPTEDGEELMVLVEAGIVWQVSVGYSVLSMKQIGVNAADEPVFLVDKWCPHEVSFVSVAADPSVGVGRSENIDSLVTRALELYTPVNEVPAEAVTQELQEEVHIETKSLEVETSKTEAIAQAVIDPELERISTLKKLGDVYKAESLAQKCIDDKSSVEEFQRALAAPAINQQIEKKEKTMLKIDLNKEIRAMAGVKGYELSAEVSELSQSIRSANKELMSKSQMAGGITIPLDAFAARAYNVTTAAQGGNTIDTVFDGSKLVEYIFGDDVLGAIGTDMSALDVETTFPRQLLTGTPTYGHGENTAAGTHEQFTFQKVVVTPHRTAFEGRVTTSMLLQSGVDIVSLIRKQFMLAWALEKQKSVFSSTQTGPGADAERPNGLLDLNVQELTGVKADLTKACDDIYLAVRNAKGAFNAYVMNPTLKTLCKRTKLDAGSAVMLCEDDKINGFPVIECTELASGIIWGGDFSQVMVPSFGGVNFIVDNITGASNGLVKFVVEVFWDIQVKRPEHVVHMVVNMA